MPKKINFFLLTLECKEKTDKKTEACACQCSGCVSVQIQSSTKTLSKTRRQKFRSASSHAAVHSQLPMSRAVLCTLVLALASMAVAKNVRSSILQSFFRDLLCSEIPPFLVAEPPRPIHLTRLSILCCRPDRKSDPQVICPDGKSECPVGTTCCYNSFSSLYYCCPVRFHIGAFV